MGVGFKSARQQSGTEEEGVKKRALFVWIVFCLLMKQRQVGKEQTARSN